ncbi:MAG: hypothetical protein NXI27_26640 [Alphaproteobacteria bacterium]|nr:hypothetical protein [Alphaproteobacteria bacterium]
MDPGGKTLHLQLIGAFECKLDDGPVRLSLAASQLLLGYLALCPRKTESRAKLAATLWEESEEHRARRNLRQVLHNLRADCDGTWDGLEADRSTISLRSGGLETDLDRIVEDLGSGVVPDRLIETPLIHTLVLSTIREPGDLFTSWLRLKRTEFENTLRGHLERIISDNNDTQAERAARALLSLDASDEAATRFLIRLYDDRGETGRALDVYAALWDHLDDEYGMEPAQPTQDLIAAVKSGTRPKAIEAEEESRADTGAFSGPTFRISFLPISTVGEATQETQIAEIFRSELISRLVRFRQINVIDANVRDMPADYSLKLVIAPAAEHLTFIATLTRISDGVVIWSDRFENMSQNWWQHQARLAGRLAAACSLSLSRTRLSEITQMSTVSGAVDNWLLGQKLLNDFRSSAWDEAAGCFRKAIALDPGFSMAYSSLSQHHNIGHLVRPGLAPDNTMLAQSKALANRAIALDPLDSRAHLCRAWASCLLREHAQAAASFSMARQCNEDDPWTVISSALGAAFNDDLDLARLLASRFLEEGWTTSLPQWGYHANIRFLSGDDEGCIEAAENAGDGIGNLPAWKAAALWHLAEHDQAAEAWGRFETHARSVWASPNDPSTPAILDWFLSCFPIRNEAMVERLKAGVSGAAECYRH